VPSKLAGVYSSFPSAIKRAFSATRSLPGKKKTPKILTPWPFSVGEEISKCPLSLGDS